MFNTLIESKPKKKRTVAGTFSSVVIHAVIIFFAVYATANAREANASKPRAENVKFVEVKKEEPKPEPERPKPKQPEPEPARPKQAPRAPQPVAPRVEAPAPPNGFHVLQAPVNIPVRIPDIDLSRAVTSAADFSGKGVAGGTGSGREGGTPGGTGTGEGPPDIVKTTYREHEVEVEARLLSGGQPSYPDPLRASGVEGRVVVEFVVNENGRVQPGSLKVIQSDNALFTAAVRAQLPNMRFSPARVGGRAVKQYVQLPLTFRLDRT